mmetsp:Transcript_33192/g.105872  ORF Transcript_33192/g.105872 Transcript_33192/m.105872 type:complete len:254 (+) Transcript_33192:346-1107(+)
MVASVRAQRSCCASGGIVLRSLALPALGCVEGGGRFVHRHEALARLHLAAAIEDDGELLVRDHLVLTAERRLARVEREQLLQLVLGDALAPVRLLADVLELALGDDQLLELQLLLGLDEDLLLDRPAGGQPVHHHALGLADAVAAVLRLQVHVRVPVAVEDDARVCRHEVDAEPARAGREQKDVDRLVRVEVVHRLRPVLRRHAAVEAAALVAAQGAVLLQDVEHPRHLREDEHLVPILGELRHQPVEQQHLA